MNNLVAVFIGGGLGSLARYGVNTWMTRSFSAAFPLGTLTSNIISSAILGLFLGICAGKPENENQMRFLIAIGFCGGFSTFSSFSAETFELIKNGMIITAAANIFINVFLCITLIGGGWWLGKSIL